MVAQQHDALAGQPDLATRGSGGTLDAGLSRLTCSAGRLILALGVAIALPGMLGSLQIGRLDQIFLHDLQHAVHFGTGRAGVVGQAARAVLTAGEAAVQLGHARPFGRTDTWLGMNGSGQ
jgi:hypothetical protein